MSNSFINPELRYNNLESYIVRKEIFRAITESLPYLVASY